MTTPTPVTEPAMSIDATTLHLAGPAPAPATPTETPADVPAYDVGRRRLPARVLLVALGLVVLLLGALAGYLVTRPAGNALEQHRRDALTAARSSSRLVFSYDYRHLAKDFAAAQAVTTGAFRKEYAATTGKLVSDVAPRYQAVVVADVSNAAIESATADRAVVLVFVNQQSTSTVTKAAKLTQSRLEMTLVRIGGNWLVSGVKAL